ncbi:MAG: hypothetical protein ACOCQA_02300 [bacterium]
MTYLCHNNDKIIVESYSISTDSQKESLFDLLGMKYNSNKDNIYSISDLIYSWLSEKRFSEKQFVEGFFIKLNKKM